MAPDLIPSEKEDPQPDLVAYKGDEDSAKPRAFLLVTCRVVLYVEPFLKG